MFLEAPYRVALAARASTPGLVISAKVVQQTTTSTLSTQSAALVFPDSFNSLFVFPVVKVNINSAPIILQMFL
jgi:hypothetical protein